MTLREYKSAVASLGCLACRHLGYGPTPAQLHHPRAFSGLSQRASDWLVVPLCREHHTGNDGVHGANFYMRTRLTEGDLLAMTIEAMQR